jgi:hypothetical protein
MDSNLNINQTSFEKFHNFATNKTLSLFFIIKIYFQKNSDLKKISVISKREEGRSSQTAKILFYFYQSLTLNEQMKIF